MKLIAETASNHMGDMNYLKKLTFNVIEKGADIVTVQIFKLDSFISKYDNFYNSFKKLYIEPDKWIDYFKWCNSNNIDILPCILDEKSADMCLNNGFKKVKIHASDILNYKYLHTINKWFDNVFLEFGGASLDEIKKAIKILDNVEIVLLYGFNAYPTKLENQNFNFIETLKYIFKIKVGFCDHTLETDIIPMIAMAKGANYFEKHVTLRENDKNRYDWEVSVSPTKIGKIKRNINRYNSVLGDYLREVSDDEKKFREVVYKKIVANIELKSGDIIRENDIRIKRSKLGLEGCNIKNIIGKKLQKLVREDEPITEEKIKGM